MPDSHVKILDRLDYHTLQNLSSNTIEKKEPEMSRIANSFEISFIYKFFWDVKSCQIPKDMKLKLLESPLSWIRKKDSPNILTWFWFLNGFRSIRNGTKCIYISGNLWNFELKPIHPTVLTKLSFLERNSKLNYQCDKGVLLKS